MRDPWPLTLFVPGHPRAYGSKSAGTDGKGRAFVRESSRLIGPWKREVKAAMRTMLAGAWAPHADAHMPLIDRGQAVDVAFGLFIPTPKNTRNLEPYPTRKSGPYAGDWDKMARAVGDCGTDVGLWWDDCQIVTGLISQRWADWGRHVGQPAGVLISFWPTSEGEG